MCHNVTNVPQSKIETEAKGQCHSDPKTVCDTPQPQDVATLLIWDSYLKLYRRYAQDMIFLEPRPAVAAVKVTVNWKQYALPNPKMYPHTKFPMRYAP